MQTPAEVRFWRHVDRRTDDECWPWLGAKHRAYGQFTKDYYKNDAGQWRCRTVRAHRFAYELLVGRIPVGLTIDHLCRNPGCVNPAHMEPVTATENSSRANKTDVCKKAGHPLTEDNVIRRPSKPGERECRKCANARNRQRRAERNAAA